MDKSSEQNLSRDGHQVETAFGALLKLRPLRSQIDGGNSSSSSSDEQERHGLSLSLSLLFTFSSSSIMARARVQQSNLTDPFQAFMDHKRIHIRITGFFDFARRSTGLWDRGACLLTRCGARSGERDLSFGAEWDVRIRICTHAQVHDTCETGIRGQESG